MGDVPGCNSMKKSTSLCGGNPVDRLEKRPHTRKPLEVDPNIVSPHSLG